MKPDKQVFKRSWLFFFLLFLFTFYSCHPPSSQITGSSPGPSGQEVASPKTADDLFVVDCLLSGQVRKLGKMTYMTPRRPIKTTAADCEIRGGEYVAYDRSNYATSLNVWLEKAETGDMVAQNHVGEIYEKGIGGTPQYEFAADWFQKSADQGYKRAKLNLGYLFEQGLGVSKDPLKALNFYREATGLPETILAEDEQSVIVREQRRELEKLRIEAELRNAEIEMLHRQLNDVQSELQRMRQEYDRRKGEIEKEHEKLALIKAKIERSKSPLEQTDSSKLKSLEMDLRRKERLIAKKDEESARLQNEIARFENEKRQASDSHSVELNNLSNKLNSLESLLKNDRQQAAALKNEIKELEKFKNQAVKSRERTIRRLKEALLKREGKLAKQREETKRLNQEIARLEVKDKEYRNQLSQIKENLTNLDGPTINIIEPRVVEARGLRIVAVKPGSQSSRIIGKVQASTGIYSCTVNQKEVVLDSDGLFRVSIPLQRSKDTPVEIVAVDKKGKRADFTFMIPLKSGMVKSVSVKPKFTSLSFGRYHALVIGNNDYQKFPKLDSAINDANKFSKVLAEKYNFNTKVLINATRYDILKELDEFRRNLKKNDNFLLYYAGHGELDRKNRRGYWLPIDAIPDSNVNSIPNFAITDILNTMEVKQAIIVADTCYSGILTRSAINRNRNNSELGEEKRYNWLKKLTENRSRTVLTSGGLKPVLDSGSGDHSVFAKALIEVLEPNQEILEASQLHTKIGALVSYSSSELGLEQVPQYAANLHAGHVSGDFLFVPSVFQ